MEISRLEFQSAYAYLLAAMELVEHAMEAEAAQHRRDFIWQMQQLGLNEISLPDRFLPYEDVRATLMLLQSLAGIEETLIRIKPADGQKAFLPSLPLMPQMQGKVAGKIDQHRQRYRSILDKERQTATGITRYTWSTQGDGKVRPSHAQNKGQSFAWDSPPPTGHPGEDFGCRCTAEPLTQEIKLPDDLPIEPVYPIEALIGLLSGSGVGYWLGLRVIEKFRTIQNISLNNTSKWPKPPTRGRLREGLPSRQKPRNRGEKSLYDKNGGEWRYDPGDKYHNPHWNYKPPGKAQEWQNITIGKLPHLK